MQDLQTDAKFTSIFEEYGQILRQAIAAQCRGSPALETEDIMQEACLRLWRALSAEKEIHPPPSYLYRIAATVTIGVMPR